MRASVIVVFGAACLALACASAIEPASEPASGPEDAGSATELVFVSGGVYTVDPLPGIKVGKRGDLVVLERDLFSSQPEQIGEVRVLETLVEGRSVFSAR